MVKYLPSYGFSYCNNNIWFNLWWHFLHWTMNRWNCNYSRNHMIFYRESISCYLRRITIAILGFNALAIYSSILYQLLVKKVFAILPTNGSILYHFIYHLKYQIMVKYFTIVWFLHNTKLSNWYCNTKIWLIHHEIFINVQYNNWTAEIVILQIITWFLSWKHH